MSYNKQDINNFKDFKEFLFSLWWFYVVIAIVFYIALKFIFPYMASKTGSRFLLFFYGIFSEYAWVVSLFFLLIAASIFIFSKTANYFSKKNKNKDDPNIKNDLSEFNNNLEAIDDLSWKQFKELIAEAFRKKGYDIIERNDNEADGFIDIKLIKKGELTLVQCKHWKAFKIDVKTVREIYGVLVAENASKAIVVTSGTFTQTAKDFAKDKPLELIEGKQLIDLITKVKNDPEINPGLNCGKTHHIADIANKSIICPECGNRMKIKIAKKGKNKGKQFWVCSKYPDCKSIKAVKFDFKW